MMLSHFLALSNRLLASFGHLSLYLTRKEVANMNTFIKKTIAYKIVVVSSMFIFPTYASAHVEIQETKRVACGGYTYFLTSSNSGSMNLIQAGKRTTNFSGMKFHTEALEKMMKNGSNLHGASLKCENGSVKMNFPNKFLPNKIQSLLLLKSGRIMDVTPLGTKPVIPQWGGGRYHIP